MGFFNLYKPREYGYRYIYYDPKKEARQEREKRLAEEQQGNAGGDEFKTTLRKGYLREMARKNKPDVAQQIRKSNIRLILILALLLILTYFLLT